MLFIKRNIVKVQMIALAVSMVLLAGCTITLPETVKSQPPAPASAIEAGVDSPAAVVVAETVDQIPDQQALAEYQLHLGDTTSDRFETIVSNEMSDQIADRQALAEYQLRLSDGSTVYNTSAGHLNIETELPLQIPDRQALAEYQLRLSGGDFGD